MYEMSKVHFIIKYILKINNFPTEKRKNSKRKKKEKRERDIGRFEK